MPTIGQDPLSAKADIARSLSYRRKLHSTGGCTFLTFADDCNVPGTRFEDGSETRVVNGNSVTVCSRTRRVQSCPNCLDGFGCRPTTTNTFRGSTVVSRIVESTNDRIAIPLTDDIEPQDACSTFCASSDGLPMSSSADLSSCSAASVLPDSGWFLINDDFDQGDCELANDNEGDDEQQTCVEVEIVRGCETSRFTRDIPGIYVPFTNLTACNNDVDTSRSVYRSTEPNSFQGHNWIYYKRRRSDWVVREGRVECGPPPRNPQIARVTSFSNGAEPFEEVEGTANCYNEFDSGRGVPDFNTDPIEIRCNRFSGGSAGERSGTSVVGVTYAAAVYGFFHLLNWFVE